MSPLPNGNLNRFGPISPRQGFPPAAAACHYARMAGRKKEPKLRMVCEECGSTHVTRDAWAEWDEKAQDWVLGAIYDYAFCHTCQGDAHIEEQPIQG